MSQKEIENYLESTSPLSNMQAKNKFLLKDIHNSLDAKMLLMREQPKNYNNQKIKKKGKYQSIKKGESDATSIRQFSQLKANSIIYNLPELTPPQINFQVSNLLRSRINQIKSDIVTKFPNIKSSQYNSNKLQNIFSRRTVLKDLQDWLQQKLKNPPLTQEDSIQYKNMIMSVGMKEVIRLIGTRCNEQANIVNQIWELTWSICRQIILYLSKRAHRCEKILMQETQFFRAGCQKRMNQSSQILKSLKNQNTILKERSQKLSKDLAKMRKKHKQLRLICLNATSVNTQLREQFEIAFKENILLHLKAEPFNIEYKKIARQRYINVVDKSNIKDKKFQDHMRKIMKQTCIDVDNDDIGMMELAIDINQFKLEEENRKFKVEQELLDMFKTKEISTQTLCIEQIHQFIQTHLKQFSQLGVETERKIYQNHQVNTDEPTIPSTTKSKLKKDKQKQKKTKKQVIKKDDSKVKKLNKKLTLDIVLAKQSQNEDEQQGDDKIQENNTDVTNQYEIQKSSINGENSMISKQPQMRTTRQQVITNKTDNGMQLNLVDGEPILQDIKSKTMRVCQNQKKQDEQKYIQRVQVNLKTQKIVSFCKEQQTKNKTNIEKQINKQTINQISKDELLNQNSKFQNAQNKNLNEEKLQQKQQQIQKLRAYLSEIQNKYENKVQMIKAQLSNKNKTIFQLNSQINQLKGLVIKIKQQQNLKNIAQQKNDNKQTSNMNLHILQNKQQKVIKDEDKQLINLIRQQKYGQIYSILSKKMAKQNPTSNKISMKTILLKQNNKYIDAVQQQQESSGIFQRKGKSTKQIQKQIMSTERLMYQYNKKTVEERKKSSIHSRDVEFVRNSIEETDEQRENSNKANYETKKMSRRSSNTSLVQVSNLNINQFTIKRKKHQQEQNKAHFQLNLKFVELCTKQFYMHYSTQGVGKVVKQNGLSENSKRMFRDQYRQIYKQIIQGNHGQKSQKQMRMVIEKATNNLIKELCKDVITAQKQGLQRLQQLKHNYTTLPIMLINRFNRNYGVKKVASKNIKDLLASLKGIKKYTDKYSIMNYFMLGSTSVAGQNLLMQYVDSQLFFMYILLMTLIDGVFSNVQIDQQQILSICMVVKKHLTCHPQFIDELSKLPQRMRNENNNNSFNNFFNKFANMYKNLYQDRAAQLQFIYLALSTKTKQGKDSILFEDFIEFLSVFDIKSQKNNECSLNTPQAWLTKVIKCLRQVLNEQKGHIQNYTITRESFIKFLVKCPQFNSSSLLYHLNSTVATETVDLSEAQKQNEVLQMCAPYQLLYKIAKYMFESESASQQELDFWWKFIQYYITEKNAEQIMGYLIVGVLDPRTKSILLN